MDIDFEGVCKVRYLIHRTIKRCLIHRTTLIIHLNDLKACVSAIITYFLRRYFLYNHFGRRLIIPLSLRWGLICVWERYLIVY